MYKKLLTFKLSLARLFSTKQFSKRCDKMSASDSFELYYEEKETGKKFQFFFNTFGDEDKWGVAVNARDKEHKIYLLNMLKKHLYTMIFESIHLARYKNSCIISKCCIDKEERAVELMDTLEFIDIAHKMLFATRNELERLNKIPGNP